MFKYTILILIFLVGYDDRKELPIPNLKSLIVAYIPANSNLVNEGCYYINHIDSVGKILTEQVLNSDTTLLAKSYSPNLCLL